MDQEYLDLFKNIQNENLENLNETQKSNDGWENLNVKKEQQKWQSINETPDVNQYKQYENLNSDLNIDVQFETKINGVVQNQSQTQHNQSHPYHNKPKRQQPQQIFEDMPLNEVIQEPKPSYPEAEVINESLEDVDVVSVDFFNRMGNAAMLELANKKGDLLK